jgi:hypothetical protein
MSNGDFGSAKTMSSVAETPECCSALFTSCVGAPATLTLTFSSPGYTTWDMTLICTMTPPPGLTVPSWIGTASPPADWLTVEAYFSAVPFMAYLQCLPVDDPSYYVPVLIIGNIPSQPQNSTDNGPPGVSGTCDPVNLVFDSWIYFQFSAVVTE